MKHLVILLLSVFLVIISTDAFANRTIQNVSYYASLRSGETNVRAGPGQNYPVKFTFKLRGMPVRVVSEYDNWSEIEDYENQTGWVMQSLLTDNRNIWAGTDNGLLLLSYEKIKAENISPPNRNSGAFNTIQVQ